MAHPARLPIDCPRCENRGVRALDDDRTIACLLCNNWCSLCLDGVPTFVPMTRPYRGSLITGMRPTVDGERLFEGYACDYHKATLKSYSLDGTISRDLQEKIVSFQRKQLKVEKEIAPEQIYDFTILNALNEELKKVGQ